jgi:hypothetical protein
MLIACAYAGNVVALGDGRTMDGEIKPFYLKEGNTVGSGWGAQHVVPAV